MKKTHLTTISKSGTSGNKQQTPNTKLQLYSPFQIACKYVRYLFTASNGKGHGVHSPYVFEWIEKALNGKENGPIQTQIESQRKQLLANSKTIEVKDLGAGSTSLSSTQRKISAIAQSSLKSFKYASLLHRIADFHGAETIVELGTSLGLTTSYLASIPSNPSVYTFEGVPDIAKQAASVFEALSLRNITLIQGHFDETLPAFLKENHKLDLVYIDGNHRKEPTLNYFKQILQNSHENTMMIFDDIHWSKEMEEAWDFIKAHESVTLSMDLFFIGIVMFRKDFKVKQHFVIRY